MPHPDAVPSTLRSQVWLRTGWFSNEPAILELANGRLSLVREEGPVFEAPLSQVSASYKWYRFQCGCKLRIAGRTYPIDFMRPNGGRDFSGQVPASTAIGAGTLGVQGAQMAETVAGLADLVGGRSERRMWHTALTRPGTAT